ncbi:unnamed protein product [Kuraishia capsulata CBS 1993]|uniref:Protein kinase domain-containing protein n=1 Tax=Kuraishia capsulata CBS 1993 TaxID=1382522 RepID=W6MT51_9ASCO|nr:uncharacterized protein KUCA_T00000907001 [Kuraishia capsulata CBS 1993]CDK24940.1 unnamed protein product [Kuraishia capsulata CBS 1993]
MRSVEFSEIEQDKENIQSLREGRSAFGLAKLFKSERTRDKSQEARGRFEEKLKILEELDDPLEPFVEYLGWLNGNFPQGSSERVVVLRQCASHFVEDDQYKNDIRYLKIWLEYCVYAENPYDSFVLVFRKGIGRDFALYYEEFAKYLEANRKHSDASEIYQMGIDYQARPVARLTRSYNNFKLRFDQLSPEEREGDRQTRNLRQTLDIMRNGDTRALTRQTIPALEQRKRTISVLRDEEPQQHSLRETLQSNSRVSSWNLVVNGQSGQENSVPATSWAGQVVPMEVSLKPQSERIRIFTEKKFPVKKLVQTPGKRDELVNMNLDMLEDPLEGECCAEEILMMARGLYRFQIEASSPQAKRRLSNNRLSLGKSPSSPTITMTMFTKAAVGDVYGMINQPLSADDGETTTFSEEGEYITQTLIPLKASQGEEGEEQNGKTAEANEDEKEKEYLSNLDEEEHRYLYPTMTPITEVTETSATSTRLSPPREEEPVSSPFLDFNERHTVTAGSNERPGSAAPSMGSAVIDPTNRELRLSLLHKATPSLDSFRDYHHFNRNMDKLKQLKKKTKHSKGAKGNGEFCLELGDLMIDVVGELGEGGYATVFYGETSHGDVYAIKVEGDRPIAWEFFLLKQIQQKFEEDAMSPAVMASVINAKGFYQYQDESYLLLDYQPQGTILDLFNDMGGKVDEQLTVFLVAELLKIIIALHRIKVIHGDMKAENCMVRFSPSPDWESQYSRYGSRGWEQKGVKLIDFGRSIDMSLLPPVRGFNCNWKEEELNELDCSEMREKRPWTYQPDMYGIAAIAHLLLFGKHIQTIRSDSGRYSVKGLPKRGLKYEDWSGIFDVLLNPASFSDLGELPIPHVLEAHLDKLDSWLEQVTVTGDLKSIIMRYEEDTHARRKSVYR